MGAGIMSIALASGAPAQPPHTLKILGVTLRVAVTIGQIIGSGILRSPSVITGEVPGHRNPAEPHTTLCSGSSVH